MIDLVGKRFLFIGISLLIIIPGLLAVLFGGLKPGIDFTGGTRWEVKPLNAQANDTEKFRQVLVSQGIKDPAVKKAQLGGSQPVDTIVMDLPGELKADTKAQLENAMVTQQLVAGELVTDTVSLTDTTALTGTATVTAAGTVTSTGTTTGTTGSTGTTAPPPTQTTTRYRIVPSSEVTLTSVGPTVGTELVGRAFIAIGAASLVILVYLTLVFRKVPNSVRYGVCAIIALLHDVLVVMGVFAILGLFFGLEIDALFVTAMLTVIGFSVHDTIVVFDRIRENIARRRFERFEDTVNYSVVQTLARSINTSVTVLLTLFALYLFGGTSIQGFVLALLIGILSGTYSSIFNASMLLVIWENREWTGPRRGTAVAEPVRSAAR